MQRDENLRREMIRKKQTSSDRGYDEKEDEEKEQKTTSFIPFGKHMRICTFHGRPKFVS